MSTSEEQPKPAHTDIRTLHYSDIRSLEQTGSDNPDIEEQTINLTGDMEIYTWSFNNETFPKNAHC